MRITDEMIEAARDAYHKTENGYAWFFAENNFTETIGAMLEAALQTKLTEQDKLIEELQAELKELKSCN